MADWKSKSDTGPGDFNSSLVPLRIRFARFVNDNSFLWARTPFRLLQGLTKPLKVQVEVTNKVHQLARSILDVKQMYKAFLDSKGEKAQMALDTMQKVKQTISSVAGF
ncbi:hypothetical protein P691DRAFT_760197 [Macrolepiota fuliginosa MF-IS2]|uniref:Uncharacterized protein n=1 Tax=Macrolepiota fuliginosa MF-IS2 TaxID=1400762 RepID=A0A9P5XD33_9AGAR|nr:hypothetical protein P691DRAFT_760197 [Macrolepiota fuliginosa MF-IS2]